MICKSIYFLIFPFHHDICFLTQGVLYGYIAEMKFVQNIGAYASQAFTAYTHTCTQFPKKKAL